MKTIPPPHQNPSAPRFKLPAQSCDAHCHVFGPGEKFLFAENRRYTPPDAPAEKLAALHELLGVDRVVLVQASCHGFDNAAMLAAIARKPAAMRGVAMLAPQVSDAELTSLHRAGVRGVRFNFVAHLGGAPNLDEVRAMAKRIAPLGWHLVFHLDAEDLPTYESFLRTLDVRFVIDHMGRPPVSHGISQPAFLVLLNLMNDDRVWVKVSGAERISAALSSVSPPYVDAAPFAQALMQATPDRVLWGTDWPHPNVREMPDDGVLVDLLPHFSRDDVALQKLLVENPARLYWCD